MFSSRALPDTVLSGLGINHVKGVLLYGPPGEWFMGASTPAVVNQPVRWWCRGMLAGTGKTLLARQLAKFLASAHVQFVRGPEILNKYVGASEANIRGLFEPAEIAHARHGRNSPLHLIIIDELDAMCREVGAVVADTLAMLWWRLLACHRPSPHLFMQRNSGDSTAASRLYDGVVNQLLANMDGLTRIDNVLVIGLTNRWQVIDAALLRPGRFEVQIQIRCVTAGRWPVQWLVAQLNSFPQLP